MQNKPYERRVTYGPLHSSYDDAHEYLRDCYAIGEISDADKPEIVLRHQKARHDLSGWHLISAVWQLEICY